MEAIKIALLQALLGSKTIFRDDKIKKYFWIKILCKKTIKILLCS